MAVNRIFGMTLILATIWMIGCDKCNLANNQEKILGTWVSIDEEWLTIDFSNINWYCGKNWW